MSSGRNKYTTTPTYGMQRRGLRKKQPEKQANSELDFTQKPTTAYDAQIPGFPDQFSGPQGIFHDPVPQQGAIPFQQMPVSNQPMVNQNPFPMQGIETPNGFPMQGISMQPSFPPQSAGMQGGYPTQGGNGQNGYPPMGMNVPTGYPMQPMGGQNGFTGYPDPFNTMNQPLTGTPPTYARPPLVNAAQTAQENTAGSVRAQGYVPPTVMRADQPMPTVPQQPNFVQQGMPYQDQPLPYNQPMYTQPPQPQPNTPGMGAYPGYQFTNDGGQPPIQPTGPAPKQPVNIDNWLKMLLYIILPLIFVLCIALPGEFDIIRYLFMIASASSVGIMWYRQTFGSSMRTGISIGYGLMCIIVVVMMASGNSDLVNTGANITAQPTPVITDEPSAGALGYQADQAPVTTSPVEVLPKDTEAGQRLSAFMDNWMENRVEDMLNYVMPAWRQTKTDAAAELFIIISNRTPQEYSIEAISGTDNDTSRSITMNATIDKNNGNDPVRYRFVILMDYEEGDWYVDPNSLSTNDIDDKASATTVPSDLDAIFTLAPRMTVTPVPPDSTILYYNANGGTYYHADPECNAVNAKYLPMATFTYGELGNAPYNQLRPCLKCNAPTK